MAFLQLLIALQLEYSEDPDLVAGRAAVVLSGLFGGNRAEATS